jgi:tRNA pseudouridine55 synthase
MEFPINHIDEEMLQATLSKFIGTIDQQPPVFSALKKDGKRLYEYAREGTQVEVPHRKVNVHDFNLTQIDLPNVDFRVSCSKGTYIRSLANDFGKALNSGAYLTGLRRTRIGDFNIEKALSIEGFEDLLQN